jgi:signal peptidase II
MQGAVVDWINFQWWPVFNVADAAICVGAVLLAVIAIFGAEPET